MREHETPVGGEGDVELQRMDAHLHGVAQPGKGVLGPEPSRTPMTVNFDMHIGDLTAMARW
ncbi:hypothetical protein GCM10010412_027220 [Nonomuraea recticatena]|uniref:Uncharacterized protein n=1 Tax=Nonomuraea recticatena TaxID=46178 RepID=A0ABN3RNT6_9ACTN